MPPITRSTVEALDAGDPRKRCRLPCERGEGVTFLEEPHPLGDTRAVMIEGPSREALELVEVAR